MGAKGVRGESLRDSDNRLGTQTFSFLHNFLVLTWKRPAGETVCVGRWQAAVSAGCRWPHSKGRHEQSALGRAVASRLAQHCAHRRVRPTEVQTLATWTDVSGLMRHSRTETSTEMAGFRGLYMELLVARPPFGLTPMFFRGSNPKLL